MDNLIELFCVVDDFCKDFMPEFEYYLLQATSKARRTSCKMSMSEIMTIVIHFHQSHYRDFKAYYFNVLRKSLKPYFPNMLSYTRFVEVKQTALLPLIFFIHYQSKSTTGIYFVDSTTISVCHVKRANSNKVFRGLAKKSKSTMGWYFGFKLHILINDRGELMAFKITESTTDDRKAVPELAKGLIGKLVGDKGYISKPLFDDLFAKGLQLITKIKKNMKNKLMPIIDKYLLRKRVVVESVIDQLKNVSQIEHSRHRSVPNFMLNIIGGLAAYALQPKKPSLNISQITVYNP